MQAPPPPPQSAYSQVPTYNQVQTAQTGNKYIIENQNIIKRCINK